MTPNWTDARPWLARAALTFVVVTLAALVLVPVLVQRRVDDLREAIEASEPARTLVLGLRFDLVREMVALNDLLQTGDPAAPGAYGDARAHERQVFDELAPLARALGPDIQRRFAEVRALAERWHVRVGEEAILEGRGSGTTALRAARESQLFDDVLAKTEALDSAILAKTARVRAQIASSERTGLALTVLLGLLALIAGAAVAMLEARARRFAQEAEARRAEAEAAFAEVARANEARARLLRGVTHDVKNPLGAAKGYADLLAMGVKAPMHPEQAPLVEGIARSVDGALAIIADLLDLARAESSGLRVERVPAELTRIARDAVEDQRAAAEAAGHTLEFDSKGERVEVYTDPTRVRQVLGNLLSNAIKYTPSPGRITVRTELVDDDAIRPGSWAAVRVSDDGPGIPADLRDAVFEEFTRLQREGEVKGHGLGLAIARGIARILGGDLTIAEQDAPGTTFVLWLPRRDSAEKAVASG